MKAIKSWMTPKDLLAIGSVVVGIAIAWGVMTQRLDAQEQKVRELKDVPTQLAVISERLGTVQTDVKDLKTDLRAIRTELNKSRSSGSSLGR